MKKEILTTGDKRALLIEFSQVATIYALIASLFIGTGVLILQLTHSAYIAANRVPVTTAFIAISVSLLILFVMFKFNSLFRDLLCGYKFVISGVITDKKEETNYGWHANPGADLATQPKLVEYFVLVDAVQYMVNKDLYNTLSSGDSVQVSLSGCRNNLLGIEKEIHATHNRGKNHDTRDTCPSF